MTFISVCIAGERLAHLSSFPAQLDFRDLPDLHSPDKINEQAPSPVDLFCLAVLTSSAVLPEASLINHSVVLNCWEHP